MYVMFLLPLFWQFFSALSSGLIEEKRTGLFYIAILHGNRLSRTENLKKKYFEIYFFICHTVLIPIN